MTITTIGRWISDPIIRCIIIFFINIYVIFKRIQTIEEFVDEYVLILLINILQLGILYQ